MGMSRLFESRCPTGKFHKPVFLKCSLPHQPIRIEPPGQLNQGPNIGFRLRASKFQEVQKLQRASNCAIKNLHGFFFRCTDRTVNVNEDQPIKISLFFKCAVKLSSNSQLFRVNSPKRDRTRLRFNRELSLCLGKGCGELAMSPRCVAFIFRGRIRGAA